MKRPRPTLRAALAASVAAGHWLEDAVLDVTGDRRAVVVNGHADDRVITPGGHSHGSLWGAVGHGVRDQVADDLDQPIGIGGARAVADADVLQGPSRVGWRKLVDRVA